jgi:hypothetical protein
MTKSYSRRHRRSHKKSSHSRKHRRSMKGGSSCAGPAPLNQTGGKRHRRNRGTRKVKRGGMMNGIMEATRQALLPFLLFASQKHVQNRVQKKR